MWLRPWISLRSNESVWLNSFSFLSNLSLFFTHLITIRSRLRKLKKKYPVYIVYTNSIHCSVSNSSSASLYSPLCVFECMVQTDFGGVEAFRWFSQDRKLNNICFFVLTVPFLIVFTLYVYRHCCTYTFVQQTTKITQANKNWSKATIEKETVSSPYGFVLCFPRNLTTKLQTSILLFVSFFLFFFALVLFPSHSFAHSPDVDESNSAWRLYLSQFSFILIWSFEKEYIKRVFPT